MARAERPCVTLFGLWFRNQRKELVGTQNEFARASGMRPQDVSKYESGGWHPGRHIAERIAVGLNMPVDEVLEMVAESKQYRERHGDDGVLRLLSEQPEPKRPTPILKRRALIRSARPKKHGGMWDLQEPTAYLRVAVPLSVLDWIVQECNDTGQSMAEFVGQHITNEFLKQHPEFML